MDMVVIAQISIIFMYAVFGKLKNHHFGYSKNAKLKL